MTRRSLRLWMFAVALLPALAVSARVVAKPPDLPVDPNDTIPILAPPPFDLSPPSAETTPPMPEPMPAWPTITIYSGTAVDFIGNGPPSAFQAVKQETHPITLTFYPGPHGTSVSIAPSPMPAPQTMTIYHPVRPRMPLSVLYTFDECLLFGANPLLTLVPLPESLREERHTQEVIPVPPMSPAQPDGSLMFGVGVNSDAGLTGSIEFATPPVCSCPCDRYVPAIADIELSNSIMDNLDKLIEAETLYQQACQLVKNADYGEALACLKKACSLCPASRYQEMAAEVVSSMVWRVFSGPHEDADAEEQEDPPIECEPYWYDADDAGSRCPPSTPPQEEPAADERRHEVVLLRHASATEVANSVMTFFNNALSMRSLWEEKQSDVVVVPDPITNKLLITVTPRYYTDVLQWIKELDAQPPQIVIQAVVAEINLDGSADWLTAGSDKPFVFSASGDTFDRLLRNLKTQGRLDVLSRPQVMTLDNQSARIFIGQQFPIITGTTREPNGFATASVEYEPVGVELIVTPKIERDGRVLMRVTATGPDQRSMETTTSAADGETVAIVGASKESNCQIEKSVPCLGNLPVVGSLFHTCKKTKSTSEMVVLLTPHIVRTKADADKILQLESKRTDRMILLESKQNQECPPSCGMPCEKAPGVEVQVAGLIKACHLALSCGRHAKAAQLAREAYALDSERVTADPIVYKMHVLAVKMEKSKCCCGKDCPCENCDDPDCCCHAKDSAQAGMTLPSGQYLEHPPQYCPPTPVCPYVELPQPVLPPVDPSIAVELQKLFDEANAEVSKAKPNLEVVEEESEAPEAPKAVAKPFRVQSSPTGTIITYDDLLRFIPGESWTEIDLKTKRVRVLWRLHVGDKVYRVRYDGGLSVDLNVMPPTGAAENCEDPR